MRVTRHTATKRAQKSLALPDQPPAPQTLGPLTPENLEAVVSPALGSRPVDRYLTA
jgi:hypothetical protein